jgi:hypothetical protein
MEYDVAIRQKQDDNIANDFGLKAQELTKAIS